MGGSCGVVGGGGETGGRGGVDDRRGKSSDTDAYKGTEQERVIQCSVQESHQSIN